MGAYDEDRAMHAMGIDDAYRVERVLARRGDRVTELVTLDGAGPFVRKKMPLAQAHRGVWAALASSSSPYLPQVRATYEMPDLFAVVCDYVPGETLSALVERGGRIQPWMAYPLIHTVCEAAGALHARGIVHRDISPDNIVVADDGAYLIDLGSAQMLAEASPADGTREQTMGTWGFAAPEQYGFAPVDARSDIYGIGRVLGYLMTGTSPDDDGYEAALADEPRMPSAVRAVIDRACAFEPSARYQTVTELDLALSRAFEAAGGARPSRPAAASSKSGQQVERRPPRRAGMAAGIVVGAAALCVAGAIGLRGLADGGWSVSGDAKLGTSASQAAPDEATEWDVEGSVRDRPSVLEGTAGILAGPNASGSAMATLEAPLEIIESGWTGDASGYVEYAIGIRNVSADERIDYPSFTVTGYDHDGSVVFTQQQVLSTIFPGQTLYFAGVGGNGVTPARVEFAMDEVMAANVIEVAEPVGELFEVRDATAVEGTFGTSFTGTISLAGESARAALDGLPIMVGTCVSVVLRDEEGALVGGAQAFVGLPEEGESLPFSTIDRQLPAYASYEVWVIPW